MNAQIALVVPEYRTEAAAGGGVATVADFVYSALSSVPAWDVEILSPRMWSRAPESQRLLDPGSWIRGPQARVGEAKGVPVTYVGSHFAEIESLRFRSRRILRAMLARFDLVFVVSGTPAAFEMVRGVDAPVLAQVATTIKVERAKLVTKGGVLQQFYTRLNRILTYRLDLSGVRIPQLILAENPWMQEWCREHGAADVRIAMPGVDTDFFSPGAESAQSAGYIVSVGRLNDPRKDFGLLLRAYARAVRRNSVSQKLVIAGREDLPREVYQLWESLGLGSRVEVRRDLSPEQLRDVYRGADLFAMSSSEEGLGLVLVEALACGTPIVSTATEGAKSVVTTTGVGTLVELAGKTEERLADAIAELAIDTEGRAQRSEEARRAAVDHFSVQNTQKQFCEAVASLLRPVQGRLPEH